MRKVLLFPIVSLMLGVQAAFAGDYCGDHEKFEIPETRLEVFADGKPVLAQADATYEIRDRYSFDLMNPDDGFWIPRDKRSQLELSFDEGKRAIQINKSTLKLGIMSSSPSWFCRKYVSQVLIKVNAKPWADEKVQGAKFGRLKEFRDERIECSDLQHSKSLAECLKSKRIDLKPKDRLVGEPSEEASWAKIGSLAGLVVKTEDGRKVRVERFGLDESDVACLVNAVKSGAKTITLLGELEKGSQAERFLASDILGCP
jgi:hypothetical protein